MENRNPNDLLPTKIIKRQTVVLQSRFDQPIIDKIAEKLKEKLFTRINFLKSKSSEIKLTSVEKYYEQYLIVKGKYSVEHCKKLEYNLEIDKKTEKICILNEEIIIDKSNESVTDNSAFFTLSGVAHFHYENNGHYILDIKGQEIESENWSILLNNVWPKEKLAKTGLKRKLSKIQLSTQKEVDFLRSRLVKKPPDVGEVIKELFEINERKIIFCPMFKLEYQNIKNKKEATAKINGITGNILITTFNNKIIPGKFIEDLIKISSLIKQVDKQKSKETIETISTIAKATEQRSTSKPPLETYDRSKEKIQQPKQMKKKGLHKTKQQDAKPEENTLEFPAKVGGDIFHVGNEITAIIGDLEIPDETLVEETLVVKGNLTIGEKCEIQGTIKALGNIILGSKTSVKGNVVSDGIISIGPKVQILGKVVSKKTVYSEN